jgi:hypothetical protein
MRRPHWLYTESKVRPGCAWACRLCNEGDIVRDPVAAVRAHLAAAHGATTPTRVSTDVRDSIWRGVR